ncbi:MAG: hypothetical protein JZU49_03280 [Sulfuricurvum sp.]|nr:hypothetical protein [Sulfuricurvum sp.]
MKNKLLTIFVVGIWIVSSSLPVNAEQLAPNPNYGTIRANDSSSNNVTFDNFGTMNIPYMLRNSATLNNNSGGTLNMGIGYIEFLGVITSTSGGSLLNSGILNNNSGGTLNIYSASLSNYTGSTLNNSGTLNNYNYGKLYNHRMGTLNNSGTLNNYGELYNEGHANLNDNVGGTLNNSGTLEGVK